MFIPPPLPTWDAVHPIAVHLPLGVLAAAPVFLLLSMCFGRVNKGIAGATLILLLIGAAGCVLATATGEAAADVIAPTGDAAIVLEEHEELAEMARNMFLGLAGLYLLILLITAALKDRLKPAGWVAAHVVALVACALSLLVLANAGHLGGRLVHQYKIRAAIAGPPPAQPAAHDDD